MSVDYVYIQLQYPEPLQFKPLFYDISEL